MTATELIQETRAAFSDPSKRATPVVGGCYYFLKGENGIKDRMCAIGRCLIDPLKAHEEGGNSLILFNETWQLNGIEWSDELLKEEYRGFPPELWKDLQKWHDGNYNFTENSISRIGEEEINRLLKTYETNCN